MVVRRDRVTHPRGTPLKNPRSWASLLLGAVALGTGLAWMLAAAWGVAPLDAFIAGVAERTGLTVGTVIILMSSVFLAGIFLLRSRPGWGTLIAFVGVGVIVDKQTCRGAKWQLNPYRSHLCEHLSLIVRSSPHITPMEGNDDGFPLWNSVLGSAGRGTGTRGAGSLVGCRA